jgi:transposase InsO family protein
MNGSKTRERFVEDEMKKRDDEVALFRYGLIADLTRLEPGAKGLYKLLEEKAAKDYCIPGSSRTRVAEETMRTWLRQYRRLGFEALKPRPRSDTGSSRALPQEVKDLLVSLKENNADLSVQLVISEALATKKVPEDVLLAPTTVHRLLSRAGLMRRKNDDGVPGDRRRFAFEKAGEMWMSDVMHGPSVTVAGRQRRKTYLIGFLDDATRVVPHAAFALSENTAAFLPALKQAIMRRGVPKRLFVDNGAAYRSHHLSLVCAKLGITLIHARPYQPQSKGKQERWFRTVRMQLLTRLTDADTASLDALNQRLWGYVEREYHQATHRGLGDDETPLDRWAKCAAEVKYIDGKVDFDDFFLAEARRKVAKDRTVSLNGLAFEVDATLTSTTVTLRFEPSLKSRTVQVWHEGRRMADAKVVDLYANCFVKRDRSTASLAASTTPETPPPGLSFTDMKRNEEGR